MRNKISCKVCTWRGNKHQEAQPFKCKMNRNSDNACLQVTTFCPSCFIILKVSYSHSKSCGNRIRNFNWTWRAEKIAFFIMFFGLIFLTGWIESL